MPHETFLIEERGDDRPAVFWRYSFVVVAVAVTVLLVIPVSILVPIGGTIRILLLYDALFAHKKTV